ncbi:MAG: zf-HC2 domain-containing protein [Pirellulaceae bacterium]
MMLHFTCQEALDYLTDYLDGQLPAGELARLDEHLAVCPQCVDYLNNLRATVELTRHACAQDSALAQIPEELVQAILQAREREFPKP